VGFKNKDSAKKHELKEGTKGTPGGDRRTSKETENQKRKREGGPLTRGEGTGKHRSKKRGKDGKETKTRNYRKTTTRGTNLRGKMSYANHQKMETVAHILSMKKKQKKYYLVPTKRTLMKKKK